MPRNTAQTIREKIKLLAANPQAKNNNVKKLENSQSYRLRVGNWRVIYNLHDEIVTIEVIRIKARKEAYR